MRSGNASVGVSVGDSGSASGSASVSGSGSSWRKQKNRLLSIILIVKNVNKAICILWL